MATTQHTLSKSTFMYGCQCPLRLYLHKFKPELQNEEDEETAAVYIEGTNIGILARDYFPGGVNAEPPDSYSYALSVEKTRQFLKEGATIIYEAAFNFDGVLCAIDILVKKNGKWFAYEVKNSTKVKPAHIMDASFQYYVITNAGLPLEGISIIHLDNTYVKRGDIEVQKLFTYSSVLNAAKQNQNFILTKAAELKKLLANKKQPAMEPGNHCSNPYPCNFTEHCWKDVVEEEKDYGNLSIDKKGIKKFLDALIYPLFFFDFETVAHPVPVYDESRPYQQVPFQYSLHIKRTANAEIEHLEFLGDGLSDPREQLIIQLLKHCETKGTIFVWYIPFENSRLTELRRDFPQYDDQLSKVQKRLIDLMVPFKSKLYYHPGFEGSASIKRVLPVLVPELSYYDLEVQDGTMASGTYAKLKEQSEEDQEKQREALLAYCHLDTLAMVRIWEVLANTGN